MSAIPPIHPTIVQWIEDVYPEELYPKEEERMVLPCTYHEDTDDFGRAIHSLLIPGSDPDKQVCFLQENLQEIGGEEGYTPYSATSYYYIRDSRFSIPGKVLQSILTDSKIIQIGIDELVQYTSSFNRESASVATKHPSFFALMEGQVNITNLHCLASEGYSTKSKEDVPYTVMIDHTMLETSIETKVKQCRFYFEGGNVVSLTNKLGERITLIGRGSLTINRRILEEEGYFVPFSESESTPAFQRETRYRECKCVDKVTKLYLKGKLPEYIDQLGCSQLPLPESGSFDERVNQIASEIKALGLFESPYCWRYQVERYLGQLEFIKQVVWPSAFECDPEDVVILPQADYHIDCFIMPGPEGSVFLLDFGLTIDLLKKLKQLELNQEELQILESYIKSSLMLKRDLQHLYDEVCTLCEQANLTIIPVAGAFFGYSPEEKILNINFLNGISGYSQINKRFYYVTGGVFLGEKNHDLASLLMDAFRETLERLASPIKVYFVGYNPHGKQDRSNYREMMRISNKRAGVHCLTAPLETETIVFPG